MNWRSQIEYPTHAIETQSWLEPADFEAFFHGILIEAHSGPLRYAIYNFIQIHSGHTVLVRVILQSNFFYKKLFWVYKSTVYNQEQLIIKSRFYVLGTSINDVWRFLIMFDPPTYHVHVRFWGVNLDLPILASNVINARPLRVRSINSCQLGLNRLKSRIYSLLWSEGANFLQKR
jgi:hypothetical protein